MALALPAVAGLALSGCPGAGGGGGGGGSGSKSINVLMVGNPQMVDLQKLTKDSFTKDTGIKVNFTVLPENECATRSPRTSPPGRPVRRGHGRRLRDTDLGRQRLAARGRLVRRQGLRLRQGDLLKPMVQSLSGEDGKLYGLPFYGESSFLMYRKDIFQRRA